MKKTQAKKNTSEKEIGQVSFEMVNDIAREKHRSGTNALWAE